MTKSLKKNSGADAETAKALAALMRRAEIEGVKPFSSLEVYSGAPEMTADFDVDAFLRQVREDRDRPASQGHQ